MKFNFKIQQYQTDAVENTVNVFAGQPSRDGFQYRRDIGKKAVGTLIYDDEYTGFRNNDIELTDQELFVNIKKMQELTEENILLKSQVDELTIKNNELMLDKYELSELRQLYKLDADYENLKWYGYGPEETYVDRMEGAKIGIYGNKVADNMAAYLVPQECGNKCGVRWAEVTDNSGIGLMFEGDEVSFSALPYTPHELENAAHVYELPPVHNTIVRVAKEQLGVGGDDSWGAPVLPQYHIDVTERLEFDFRFRGIG